MKRFFVLPFKFGTTVRDEAELKDILSKGEPFLVSLEGQVRDCIEIDVVATWEVPGILQDISREDPEIAASRANASPTHVGMLLAQALKQKAEDWRGSMIRSLQPHAKACADHDLLNDQMVLNSSFLIQGDGEKEFYRGVEEVDLFFKGKLHFRCVGPLPPYSFATMTLKRFDPEEVRRSAEILGLNGKAELTLVKKVYKELSRQCHPDTDPNLSVQQFEELNRAYELLVEYCQDGPQSLDSEAIGRAVRLTVMENSSGVRHAA